MQEINKKNKYDGESYFFYLRWCINVCIEDGDTRFIRKTDFKIFILDILE